jgi:hypothetical protein
VEAARIAWRPLGRLLVEQGLLTDDELERALAVQQATGRRLGETIVELRFVSGPDLASALATQYGIELTVETGFGTGLRAQIQRRHEDDRGLSPPPRLRIVDAPEKEPDDVVAQGSGDQAGGDQADGDQRDADDAAEALLLAQLEEQWAKLAAAEAALSERERELSVLRNERDQLLAATGLRDAAVTAIPAVEEPELEAAASTLPFHVQPQEWKLWELERLVREAAGPDPVRNEELSYLLHYLREFASPEGVLPVSFDALVRESFGENGAAHDR